MLYGLNNDQDNEINDFHQRVADRSIQSIDERQEETFVFCLGGSLLPAGSEQCSGSQFR